MRSNIGLSGCAYCASSNSRPIVDIEDYGDSKYVRVEGCELFLEFVINENCIEDYVEIRYCPMCGDELMLE